MYKYLGIEIDDDMSFNRQFDVMCQNIGYKIWLYKHIRMNMDDTTALIVFKSMVLPFFDYGCIFLTSLPAPCFQKLQVLCNIGLRICFRVRDPTYCAVKKLYKRAKMLPLDLRRIYFQLATCHRLVYSGKMDILPDSGTRATSAPCIRLPRHRLVSYVKGPTYQACSRWNALDPSIRWITDKDKFRVNIKRRLGKLFIRHWRHDYPHLIFDGTCLISNIVP